MGAVFYCISAEIAKAVLHIAVARKLLVEANHARIDFQ